MSKQKQKTICVHNMFSPWSEVAIFMYWTCNSMNNILSYCGLVDARISASEKDLPVKKMSATKLEFLYIVASTLKRWLFFFEKLGKCRL